MGADLDVEAVFQRRDDAAAARVVFRIGARDDHDVEGQADLVAFDLDVLLFHQIEETHLNFLRQVGEFIDGEDAAVRARDETVVDRFLVREVAPLGDFDRIDLADQIGDGNVGSRELFAVTRIAVDPRDRKIIAHFVELLAADAADRFVRIVVDLAALNDRYALVEKGHETPNQARFSLSAFAEKDHVMAGKNRVFNFRYDGIIIADDTGQNPLAAFKVANEVFPHFVANWKDTDSAPLEIS